MPDPALLPMNKLISSDRFNTYLENSGRDKERAARQYMWNIEISACFWGPISLLEVIFRNAIHDQLSKKFGAQWFLEESGCHLREDHERRHIKQVLEQFERRGVIQPSAGQFVGATSLGLWVGLIGGGTPYGRPGYNKKTDYDRTLWQGEEGLAKAFPNLGLLNRRQLHSKLSSIQELRNRIAHHEPIINRNHDRDLKIIIECISTISLDAAKFAGEANGVRSVLNNKDAALFDGICFI